MAAEWKSPDGVQAIVTNPPYKLADEFIRHGLALGVPLVVMLLRLNFLEGQGRSDIIDGGKLARVHLFIDRLPKMHREGWQGRRLEKEGAPFAWLVWHADHVGPTTLDRIWCSRARRPAS